MAMTRSELEKKQIIVNFLRSEGYNTYAEILDSYDVVVFDQDPTLVRLGAQKLSLAFMRPDKGQVWINGAMDMQHVSVSLRHEILHFYMEHVGRAVKHLAMTEGGMEEEAAEHLSDSELEKYTDMMWSQHQEVTNTAGDYEISNFGYTEEDKALQRSIEVYGIVVRALVTEDDHPSWSSLTLEEMFDNIRLEQRLAKKYNVVHGSRQKDGTFVDTEGKSYGIPVAVRNSSLGQEENEDAD